MFVIDLTHPIAADMPVYPGDPRPSLAVVSTYGETGYLTRQITLGSHAGTHMDAPAHMIAGGRALDTYPADRFVGRGVVLNLTSHTGPTIDLPMLRSHQDAIAGCDFVLLHTGWSLYWGKAGYFGGYPVLAEDAARWLADLGLQGVGVDTPSVDADDATTYAIHQTLLGRGILIIENLTNLDALPGSGFTFAAFPLKIADADGAPVRAVAMVPRHVGGE